MTTNLPFARWFEVFLDPTAAAAVIDWVVHYTTTLTTGLPDSRHIIRFSTRRKVECSHTKPTSDRYKSLLSNTTN